MNTALRHSADIWAIVPVKEQQDAKTRLAPHYPPELRRGLARAMAEDVVEALTRVGEISGIALVTRDPWAMALAAKYGARVFEDGAREGHTGAVMAGVRRLAQEGRGSMLTVPGDIPLIGSDELSSLIAVHRDAPSFSIVPAHDRRGSNAILMSPPDAVPLAFGDDSFLPHLDAARQRGIEPTIIALSGIGLDIDNAQDLEAFMHRPSSTRSRAFLEAHGVDRSGHPDRIIGRSR